MAGSVAGLILSGIMFFVGKDLATKEALKVVREKSGQVGEDAAKLGANIAEALKAAKPSASEGVAGLNKEMTEQLQAILTGDQTKLEGIALIKEITVQQTGFEGQLRTALEANGFDANTLKNKNLDELLNLAKTQLQQLEQLKSGITDSYSARQELNQTVQDPVARLETLRTNFHQQSNTLAEQEKAVKELYAQLIPEGQETNAVKQLAAIGKHTDTAPQLQTQLKQALLSAGVPTEELNDKSFKELLELTKVKINPPHNGGVTSDELVVQQLQALTDEVTE